MNFGFELELFVLAPSGVSEPASTFFVRQEEAQPVMVRAFGSTPMPARIYRDGWALEMSTIKPEPTIAYMLEYAAELMKKAKGLLPEGYTLSLKPAVRVDQKKLDEAPADLRVFGCKPSWNAYRMKQEGVEVDPGSHPWRSSGCHIHFSAGDNYERDIFTRHSNFDIVRLLDLYLAVPFTWLFPSPELARRREFYGLAGDFRIPGEHYLEYRTLHSEVWCHPATAFLAYAITREVIREVPWLIENYSFKDSDKVERAVNEVDLNLLAEFMPRVRKFWNRVIRERNGWEKAPTVYRISDPEQRFGTPSFELVEAATNVGLIDRKKTVADYPKTISLDAFPEYVRVWSDNNEHRNLLLRELKRGKKEA